MVGASIADGWAAFKRSPWLMIGALVLVALVNGIVSGPGNAMLEDGQPTWASSQWSALAWFATFPLGVGMSYLMLQVVRGTPGAGVEALVAGYRRYLPLLGTVILMTILIVACFVLLVVPGIIASFGLMQAPLLVVDKGLGPVEAIQGSWSMMRGYKLDAFFLGLVGIALVILGALALLVGLFVAIPVVAAAGAAFYERVLAVNPPPQLGAVAAAA